MNFKSTNSECKGKKKGFKILLNCLWKRGDSQEKGTSLGFIPVRFRSAMLIPFPDTSPQNENLRELVDYQLHINGKWHF